MYEWKGQTLERRPNIKRNTVETRNGNKRAFRKIPHTKVSQVVLKTTKLLILFPFLPSRLHV